MKKIITSLVAFSLLFTLFSFNTIAQTEQKATNISEKVFLDTSDANRGIIRISYKSQNDKKIKLMIVKGEDRYTYNLDAIGQEERFPLQLGSGEYNVFILENIEGTKYSSIFQTKFTIEIDDENIVYLNSIQIVNWDISMEAIKKATKLTDETKDQFEKISIIYNYIVNNIKYDYEKINNLTSVYVPEIDFVLNNSKGICYDYAALFAAMLRSQNIPVRLVKGYRRNSNIYHAWNEVFIESTGEWRVVDTTIDSLNSVIKNSGMFKDALNYNKVLFY